MSIFANKKAEVSRADQLRKRRAQEARPGARTHAAVAARTTWEPRSYRNAPRAHRVHSIPLSERGVEVQVPAISLSLSPRGSAALLAVAAGMLLLFLVSSGSFRAGTPDVRGTNFFLPETIADASGVRGTSLFLLSPHEVNRELVRRMPGIRSAEISLGFDGRVVLIVQERAPILLWEQAGDSYWVDADGVIFPAAQRIDGMVQVDVPHRGPEITFDNLPDIDPRVVSSALEMAVSLPVGTRIVFDLEHGLGMTDSGGWPVYFGDAEGITGKLTVYQSLVANLYGRGIRPTLVNVKDIHQPFYRR